MSLKHQLTQSTFENVLTEKEVGELKGAVPSGVWAHYGPEGIERLAVEDARELPKTEEGVTWVHWTGLGEGVALSRLFTCFGIHPLTAEDVLNMESRAKLEETSESLFVVLKIPVAMDDEGEIEMVHFCLFFEGTTVLSFSEIPLKFLEDLNRRLDDPKRRIRNLGADYLMWAILDLVTDHSLRFVDYLSDRVEELEDLLIDDEVEVSLEQIHGLKNEVSQTYRLLRPGREITSQLCISDSALLSSDTSRYFRDLHDHAAQASEQVDHLRDKATGLRELYYTLMSHRMNGVMKVLTSLSAIFLPLTFLAGLYGMNFAHMPELAWKWSYPVFLAFLSALAIALVCYFKKKRWL
ncbi:MAG: magnesium/cobalt transporter CorA [Roseibacillus sp.]